MRRGRNNREDAPSLPVRCICGRTVQGRPWLAGTDSPPALDFYVIRWHRREDGLRCSEHGVAFLPEQTPETKAAAMATRRPQPTPKGQS